MPITTSRSSTARAAGVAALVAAGVAVAGCAGDSQNAGGDRAAPPAPGAAPAATMRRGADAGPARPVSTRIASGRIRGVGQGATERFRGLRYAAAPTGERRFAAPVAAPATRGTRDATRSGARCPQPAGTAPAGGSGPMAEDCLFVDVTAPRGAARAARDGGRPKPVMVWLHGGGGTTGAGSEYDARRLAAGGDVVVMTPNYRLGALGLLALPGLRDGGTFALADQIAALRWARKNARAFGGDPSNVTVFGESQGAFSTCALLTAPAARGLFERASMSSGNCTIDYPDGGFAPGVPAFRVFTSREDADALGGALAEEVGCAADDPVACLRRAPARALVGAKTPMTQLAFGTRLLPRDPRTALAAGDVARVPVLSSGNRDEADGPVGVAAKATGIDDARFAELLEGAFGPDAGRVAAEYPPAGADANPAKRFAHVMSDRAWACPTLTGNRQLARRTRTYAAEFADPDAPDVNAVDLDGFDLGAAHASDLPSLFDLGGRSLLASAGQRELAATMIGYWSRFAHTGDPNGGGAPRWERFEGGDDVLSLAPGAIAPTDLEAGHRCAFWEGLADG